MLQGSLVALVTPMKSDGALDMQALESLIEFHIAEGTDGLVVVGTTGESPTVSVEEHCQLIQSAVQITNKRVPVIAGTGANSTQEAIELTQKAKSVGADACLLVAPYYNKPSQEGLYQHYLAVADAVDIPQILYNVPGRTASDISFDTTMRLAKHKNIVGIKDATGNIERGIQLINHTPDDFAVLSGDDGSAAALMLMGGQGVITVTGNVAPKLMHQMCAAATAGDVALTQKLNKQLALLHSRLFLEANPIPVKWLLSEMGLIGTGIRLPLVTFSAQFHESLREAARSANLL